MLLTSSVSKTIGCVIVRMSNRTFDLLRCTAFLGHPCGLFSATGLVCSLCGWPHFCMGCSLDWSVGGVNKSRCIKMEGTHRHDGQRLLTLNAM